MSLYLKCLLALIEVKKDQKNKTVTLAQVDRVLIELASSIRHNAESINDIEDIDKLIPGAALLTFIRDNNDDIPF